MQQVVLGMLRMAKDQNTIHELNRKQGTGSFRHGNGWGMAYFTGQWRIKKSLKPFYRDAKVEKLIPLHPSIGVLHVRQKTTGGTCLENTHPFLATHPRLGEVVFCHNGTIYDDITFNTKLFTLQGNTDSEKLFYSILSDVRNELTPQIIRRNLQRYHNYTGTNIILSTKDKSFITLKENSLYLKYYKMVVGKMEGGVMVSSEPFPLPGIRWRFLEYGDIVIIQHKTLEMSINKLTVPPIPLPAKS